MTPEEKKVRTQYKKRIGLTPNFDSPKLFCEKLCWLKLFDRNLDYTKMADKYEAKKYASDIIGDDHIIPTIGIYDNFDDIDFSSLPDKFVIKCTHDSGSVIIVKCKSNLDIKTIKTKIELALSKNYYYHCYEYQYKNIKPRIIIEPYLADNMRDYKFYCFNGSPKFMYVSDNLSDHSKARLTYVDFEKWKRLPFGRKNFKPHEKNPGIKKPTNLNEMVNIAKKLSKNLPFARVDMYQINDTIYFSEITFHPGAGMTYVQPEEWNKKIGDMLNLDTVLNRKLHYNKNIQLYILRQCDANGISIKSAKRLFDNFNIKYPCTTGKYNYMTWDTSNAHHMTPESQIKLLNLITSENNIPIDISKTCEWRKQKFHGKELKYIVPVTGDYIVESEMGTITGGPEILYIDNTTDRNTLSKIKSIRRSGSNSEYHKLFSCIHDRAKIINTEVDNGAILVLGDSMISPMIPVLASNSHIVDFYDWRSRPSEKIDIDIYDKVIFCIVGEKSLLQLIHFARQFIKQVY